MFENFKDCLLNNKNVYRSQRFKSYNHDAYTEENNKSSNDIKDYKHLIGLQHIHMKQILLKYVKKKDINYNKIQYYKNKYKK